MLELQCRHSNIPDGRSCLPSRWVLSWLTPVFNGHTDPLQLHHCQKRAKQSLKGLLLLPGCRPWDESLETRIIPLCMGSIPVDMVRMTALFKSSNVMADVSSPQPMLHHLPDFLSHLIAAPPPAQGVSPPFFQIMALNFHINCRSEVKRLLFRHVLHLQIWPSLKKVLSLSFPSPGQGPLRQSRP